MDAEGGGKVGFWLTGRAARTNSGARPLRHTVHGPWAPCTARPPPPMPIGMPISARLTQLLTNSFFFSFGVPDPSCGIGQHPYRLRCFGFLAAIGLAFPTRLATYPRCRILARHGYSPQPYTLFAKLSYRVPWPRLEFFVYHLSSPIATSRTSAQARLDLGLDLGAPSQERNLPLSEPLLHRLAAHTHLRRMYHTLYPSVQPFGTLCPPTRSSRNAEFQLISGRVSNNKPGL